jgi:hypothetical protein
MTPNEEVLFVAFLIAGMLFLSLSMRQWLASRALKGGGSLRLASGFSFITVGIGLLVLGLTSGPVPAKEIFAIPSNGNYDFYQVASSIQDPALSPAGTNPSAWPGVESNRNESDYSFMDAKVKDSSLIIDPGFRTSLTNRILTVAGRIVWLPIFKEFDLLKPLSEQESLDMGRLNLERLTGVYELAWVSAYESQLSGYN